MGPEALQARLADVRERLRHLTAGLTRWCEFLLIHWPLYLLLCLIFAAACFLPALAGIVGRIACGG